MATNNNVTKIFLVLNSGSSSEKFSLYEGEDEVCSLYFEGIEENGKKKFSFEAGLNPSAMTFK